MIGMLVAAARLLVAAAVCAVVERLTAPMLAAMDAPNTLDPSPPRWRCDLCGVTIDGVSPADMSVAIVCHNIVHDPELGPMPTFPTPREDQP